MVSTIADFARYGQMLLNGGTLDGKTYLSPATFAAMTTDHIGPGSGVARNYFYYPGDGFGFGYGFGVRTDPGNAVPPPPGSLGEIKWDGATGVYIVVDRAQDMFFVLMQDSPSGRMHVITDDEEDRSTTRSRNDRTGRLKLYTNDAAKPDESDQRQGRGASSRSTARAPSSSLLVLLHHSVVNYTYFGNGDSMRWLGFDLVVLFNDSFFMACMFLISGLFVRDSLTRRGAAVYLRNRAWRLGVPFLLSVFVLMPIAYYPTFLRYHLPGTTDFNFLHFWWHTLTSGHGRRAGLVSVGAAGARRHRRRGLVGRAARHPALGWAILCAAQPADDGLRRVPDRSRSRSICRCTWYSATEAGSNRAIIRFRSRPAASCFMPAISLPVSASAPSV